VNTIIQSHAPDVSDEEIVADLFRIARTGRYRNALQLMEAAQSTYRAEPLERMKTCLKQLAQILWDTDHGGYASDFKRAKHRPARTRLTA